MARSHTAMVGATILCLVLIGTACGNQEQAADEAASPTTPTAAATTTPAGTVSAEPSEVPPPPDPGLVRWIAPDGSFRVPPYDNRIIPEEEKRADPVINPRWPPFVSCMQEAGYTIAEGSDGQFTQVDMDQLVARLNATYADKQANRAKVQSGEGFEGLGNAFIACANTWLTIPSEELEEHGLDRPTAAEG